jgi:hypothetical protein
MTSPTYSGNISIRSSKETATSVAIALLICTPVFQSIENINLKSEQVDSNYKYFPSDVTDVTHIEHDYFSSHAKYYYSLMMRLDEIAALGFNWNGYDASPIDVKVIHEAKCFIQYLKDISSVLSIFPTARQSIQIESEQDHKYCEAEVFSDHITIYAETDGIELINKSFVTPELAVNGFRKVLNV